MFSCPNYIHNTWNKDYYFICMLCAKWYTFSSAPVHQMASKALHSFSTMVVSQEIMHETLDVVVLHD